MSRQLPGDAHWQLRSGRFVQSVADGSTASLVLAAILIAPTNTPSLHAAFLFINEEEELTTCRIEDSYSPGRNAASITRHELDLFCATQARTTIPLRLLGAHFVCADLQLRPLDGDDSPCLPQTAGA